MPETRESRNSFQKQIVLKLLQYEAYSKFLGFTYGCFKIAFGVVSFASSSSIFLGVFNKTLKSWNNVRNATAKP